MSGKIYVGSIVVRPSWLGDDLPYHGVVTSIDDRDGVEIVFDGDSYLASWAYPLVCAPNFLSVTGRLFCGDISKSPPMVAGWVACDHSGVFYTHDPSCDTDTPYDTYADAVRELVAMSRNRSEIDLRSLIRDAHSRARTSGFWAGPRNAGEAIALMHSELSEALEAVRSDAMSEKIPGFSGLEEELADAIIRICDYAGGMGLFLPEAIEAKMAYNATRPKKHGKEF